MQYWRSVYYSVTQQYWGSVYYSATRQPLLHIPAGFSCHTRNNKTLNQLGRGTINKDYLDARLCQNKNGFVLWSQEFGNSAIVLYQLNAENNYNDLD